ncbi:MAG: dUTP diphosphatase [Candidatus Nanoarchaeia archaeon]|nr:dUTP diphosphatase [Candidatus Nanoarchaeia archaeon]MDD5740736.1 dUTP diphosphatase [Candidatus Nanoarchaeia archaeon]
MGLENMINKISVKVKKLHPDAIIPYYAHDGDAGLDIFSNEDCIIKAGERKLISTGISMELPDGYVALVWDKSGLAGNNGLHCLAGVGDAGYRGEYKIVVFNTSKDDYYVKKGQKVSQILIQPIMAAEIEEVKELSETKRGDGGFGSTGLIKNSQV